MNQEPFIWTRARFHFMSRRCCSERRHRFQGAFVDVWMACVETSRQGYAWNIFAWCWSFLLQRVIRLWALGYWWGGRRWWRHCRNRVLQGNSGSRSFFLSSGSQTNSPCLQCSGSYCRRGGPGGGSQRQSAIRLLHWFARYEPENSKQII